MARSRCRLGKSSDGRRLAELRVTDTGPGIPEADRAAIFEAYFRSAGTAGAAGVGLGLAISQALVEQMGGTLSVESELGEGLVVHPAFSDRIGACSVGSSSPTRNTAQVSNVRSLQDTRR